MINFLRTVNSINMGWLLIQKEERIAQLHSSQLVSQRLRNLRMSTTDAAVGCITYGILPLAPPSPSLLKRCPSQDTTHSPPTTLTTLPLLVRHYEG